MGSIASRLPPAPRIPPISKTLQIEGERQRPGGGRSVVARRTSGSVRQLR